MKRLILDCFFLPFLFLVSIFARFKRKKIEIGLGPEPLINNVYHKRALLKSGYSCETFVVSTYFITSNFDINFSQKTPRYLRHFIWYIIYAFAVLRYRSLYIYFNGGPLYGTSDFLRSLEPYLLKISGTKIVVMPYGGDVMSNDLNPNLMFKYGLIEHYPDYCKTAYRIKNQVRRWTNHAQYVFSGCDWVDYTYFWNKLQLAHFSIDTEEWIPNPSYIPGKTFKILHAPNHRKIKGTDSLIDAVKRMQDEGRDVELTLLERKPNAEVKMMMQNVDLVVDQLVIGWYAMFALEGMSSGKPVICFIREDLKKLYEFAGVLSGSLPLISASPVTIYDELCRLYDNRDSLNQIGKASREFVQKHHSIEAIGHSFDECNRKIGLR